MWKWIFLVLVLIVGGEALYVLTSDSKVETLPPPPPPAVTETDTATPVHISAEESGAAQPMKHTAHRAVPPRVKYLGGLKNRHCMEGMKLTLRAEFSGGAPRGGKVRYYRDGSELEGNSFECDQAGDYTVTAKLIAEGKTLATSPAYQVHVDPLPAEIEEMQQSRHIHF
ncbi:hypothetical protein [Nitratifractor sp.]|uniref:hypothetical protein n=1 Tax=Nitratifractor sp. TaxID=2268144 RepID=UPI0025F83228|nr:hypothetical protein [Nitratifractor sp.]